MNAASCDRHDARAEVPRAGDIIRRVPNHDELFGTKMRAEIFVDSLRGNGGKVAAIDSRVMPSPRNASSTICKSVMPETIISCRHPAVPNTDSSIGTV